MVVYEELEVIQKALKMLGEVGPVGGGAGVGKGWC